MAYTHTLTQVAALPTGTLQDNGAASTGDTVTQVTTTVAANGGGAYAVLYKPLDVNRLVKMIESVRSDGALVLIVDDSLNEKSAIGDIDMKYICILCNM